MSHPFELSQITATFRSKLVNRGTIPRTAFPKKEEFVNDVPVIIPVRIRLCPAR